MSETELADLVQDTLQGNPHLMGRTLRFEAHEGRVTLHGEVASYYQKQIAQEAVGKLRGVAGVDNQLKVNYRGCIGLKPWTASARV
jgi:osmotically-inducible protein OsmY